MQKIIIKGMDAKGETMEYLKMSHATMAEMAFYAITHDPMHQDLNWVMLAEDVEVNWHHPLNKTA